MPKNLILFDLTKQNVHITDVYRIRTKSHLKLSDIGIEITDERMQINERFEAIIEL